LRSVLWFEERIEVLVNGSRRRVAGGVAAVALMVGGLGVCSPALAASMSLGGFVGGPFGPAGGQFSNPRGLGVNHSGAGSAAAGDLYIAESTNRRIQVLDAAGNFKFMFGRNVIAPGAPGDLGDAFEVCAVATDCQQGTIGVFYIEENQPQVDNPGGEMPLPQGLAVDQSTGDVFVRDRTHRNVQQFTASGQFVKSWGWNVIQPGRPGDLGDVFEVCSVAADCQAGSAGARAGETGRTLSSGTGVAVSPVDGHVFVSDVENRRVMEFDPDASASSDVFVRAFGWGVAGGTTFETCSTASSCTVGTAGVANGQLSSSQPLHLAVDANNVIYMSDASSGGTANRILRVDADLAPSSGDAMASLLDPIYSTTATTPGPLLNGITQGLAIDPVSGNLLVTRLPSASSTVVEELANPASAAPAPDAESPHTLGLQSTQGLTANAGAGLIYLAAVSGTQHGLMVLADSAGLPTGVQVDQPTSVGATDAALAGSLDPRGGIVSYLFEVSDTGAADDWQPIGMRRFVSGAGAVQVNATATGLEPNTTYRVRLAVRKQTAPTTSTQVSSSETVFLTDAAAPTVQTLGSAHRASTSATLRATVDPNGLSTMYWFEYGGRGQTLDHKSPAVSASAGSGNTAQLIVQAASDLTPATAYDYRIVAQSAAGTAAGARVAFSTASTINISPPPGRGYELVSPADKVAGAGVGGWGGNALALTEAGIAAHEGERFAAQGSGGSLLLGGAAQGYANDWAFADRASDGVGWLSHTPITHPERGLADAKFITPHAASPDLSRLAWRTNNFTARIFEELVEWPLDLNPSLLGSWDGRWEMFGPTGPLDQVQTQLSGARAHPNDFELCDVAFARDGSTAVCGTDLSGEAGRISILRGLAGQGDPTHPGWPDLVGGRSVYLADVSGSLADSYAGAGQRELVNVCAAGTMLPAVDGTGDLAEQACGDPLPGRDARLISDRGAILQPGDASTGRQVEGSLDNVVSANGSRVFFMAPDPSATGVPDAVQTFCSSSGDVCPTQLFVRQRNPDGSHVTRWLSRPDVGVFGTQEAALLGTVRFEGASTDGDKVFFRTNSPLTADDPNATGSAPATTGQASNRSWDLYMYDLPDSPGADPANGELTRVSGGPNGASDCNSPVGGAGAVGALRFVSGDGSRAYFTCASPIVGIDGPPGSGTTTLPAGTPDSSDATNFYLYDANRPAGERWRFIARLPRATGAGINSCATTGLDPQSPLQPNRFTGIGSNCVRGTDDGGLIAFITLGALTADDSSTSSAVDYYAYDADHDSLTRISAATGGGVGGAYPCVSGNATLCNADTGYEPVSDTKGRVALPSLAVASSPAVSSGSRVVFFQSRSRLTADDTDSAMDVFEWRDGQLSLVTTGVKPGVDAFYKGNDNTGRNVYFVTTDAVTWQDHDAVADVYTARISGGVAQPAPPAVCEVLGDSCQAPGRQFGSNPAPASALGDPGSDGGGERGASEMVVSRPTARGLRRGVRSGIVRLGVTVSKAGAVRAVASTRIRLKGGRVVSRQVGVGRASAAAAGRVVVGLRLSDFARRRLAEGRRIGVVVRVRAGGDSDSVRFVLRGHVR
jgi:hypothetical protein